MGDDLNSTPIVNQKYYLLVTGIQNIPMIREDIGIYSFATCIHPPGAAHKSIHTWDFPRKSNFLFSWINLKAALDL